MSRQGTDHKKTNRSSGNGGGNNLEMQDLTAQAPETRDTLEKVDAAIKDTKNTLSRMEQNRRKRNCR